MASTPIAYNPSLAVISGTQQVGNLVVGTSAQAYSTKPGNVVWWMSPDQTAGYVISAPNAGQPNKTTDTGTVRFWRSKLNTDASFLELVNKLSKKFGGGVLADVTAANTWLASNGYWTSYNVNAQGFSYSNFASTTGLVGVGNTSVSSNIYFLTTAANGQVGNVYRTTSIKYNRNFSATWSTFIGGGTSADGYCIQWTPTNNTNGSAGGGVGYVSTAINAITFLTYTNNNYTWYKNNVSQGATSVTSSFWRQTLYFWGDYNHSAQTFALYWNTTNSKPGSANKTFTSFSFDTGSYYMGFGAATGGANDNHQLLSWALTFA
jgi:hypothetical protein